MKFTKEFIVTTFSTITATLIAFLNNVIITRQLGPEDRGRYAILFNLIIIFTLVLGEGIRRTSTINVGRNNAFLKKYLDFSFLYFISILFALILLYLLTPISFLFPKYESTVIIITLVIISLSILWQSFQGILLGLRKIVSYNSLLLSSVFIYFIINLIGIWLFSFELKEILISFLVASLITSLIGFMIIKKRVILVDTASRTKISDSGSLIFRSTLAAIEIFLLYRGDIFIVNIFLGAYYAGIYSIVFVFSELLQKLPNIIGPLILSRTVTETDGNVIMNTSRLVRVILTVNIFLVLFIAIMGKYLIVFLFGLKFIDAYAILLFLIPALISFGPGAILYAHYIGKSFPKKIIISNGCIAILNIMLNIMFIPSYGLAAAAFISSITYLLWTLFLIMFFIKDYNIKIRNLLVIRIEDINYLFFSLKQFVYKNSV